MNGARVVAWWIALGFFPAAALVFLLASHGTAKALPTDIEYLCAPYGGVKGETFRKETVRGHRHTETISVDCKDGSWVMRSYEK